MVLDTNEKQATEFKILKKRYTKLYGRPFLLFFIRVSISIDRAASAMSLYKFLLRRNVFVLFSIILHPTFSKNRWYCQSNQSCYILARRKSSKISHQVGQRKKFSHLRFTLRPLCCTYAPFYPHLSEGPRSLAKQCAGYWWFPPLWHKNVYEQVWKRKDFFLEVYKSVWIRDV